MQYRSIASLALVALATTATAQQSRVFTRASQSVREFDIFARQTDGYQPEDEICGGEGSTCAEACGDGYQECSSTDEAVHCFNPAQEESCCASGNGSSCLASFFCARDSDSGTYCCHDGASLEECAVEFGATGALVSDIPAEPTPSSSSAVVEYTSEVLSSSSIVIVASSSVEISSALPTEISSSYYANSTLYEPSHTSAVVTTTTVETDSSATSGSSDESEDDEEEDPEESVAAAKGPIMALVAAIAMLATLF